jgi:hypothetical protein
MQFDNVRKLFVAIQHAFKKGQYRMTVHCLERSIERSVEVEDIEFAIESGEIIEYYPEDKYGPSCLILGYTKKRRPLHIQCSIQPVWIVTCYDPSEKKEKWSKDFRRRIKS